MKRYIYPSIILVLVITLGFVFKKYDTAKKAIPQLKERPVNVSASSEWLNTKNAIEGLIDRLRRFPDDNKTKLQLAMAYVQESRTTGDHAYYDEAAFKLVNQVLEKDTKDFNALCIKATVLLSQHHFTEGVQEAENIVALYPDAAFGYGILCDAHVELGNYDAAIKAVDKMMSIRPDLRSYSRVAYIREIHGDFEGAKEAMKLAVDAGVPGMETTEWCRVQLGQLYEKTGDVKAADEIYQTALAYRPDYAYALAGLARICKLNGRTTEGVSFLEKANQSVIDFSFYDEMADLYLADNQKDKAHATMQKVIKMLEQHANDETAAPDKGHYADLELAYAYLKMNDLDKALEHATREWNRRPENIEVNQCLAWVYYKRDFIAAAVKHIEVAMKTQSQDPTLLWRAGEIFIKNNDAEKGNILKKKALQINPNVEKG
jgi:tetratricopeptide (TPR) repeat protein